MLEAEVSLPRSEVIFDSSGVRLVDPLARKIIFPGIITGVLNAALIEKFPNLDASYSEDGGIEGICNGEIAELKNLKDTIGLNTVTKNPSGAETEILTFYKRMLKTVLQTGDIFVREQESKEEANERIWGVLRMGIINFGGEEFFQKILERLSAVSDGKREHLKREEDRLIPKDKL